MHLQIRHLFVKIIQRSKTNQASESAVKGMCQKLQIACISLHFYKGLIYSNPNALIVPVARVICFGWQLYFILLSSRMDQISNFSKKSVWCLLLKSSARTRFAPRVHVNLKRILYDAKVFLYLDGYLRFFHFF